MDEKELRLLIAKALGLTRRALDCAHHGDYSNGNEAFGADEGRVLAGGTLEAMEKELMVLERLMASGPPQEQCLRHYLDGCHVPAKVDEAMSEDVTIEGLTIEELTKALSEFPEVSDIKGFKVNPADLRYIAEQTCVGPVDLTKRTLRLDGIPLHSDASVPKGTVEVVR